MPAINVARTDTFETQRQKINQIGELIFNVTSGGSDLATGNLKLGDGTVSAPSLAFDSDNTLGFYKPSQSVVGWVSSQKKLFDITSNNLLFYKDYVVRQESISSTGITYNDFGSGYDSGSYQSVLLTGGTGSGATGDFEVIEYDGILSPGSGYSAGVYSGIPTETDGSGSGAVVTFEVEGIEGNILNVGSAYKAGSYLNIPLTGGSGTGATGNVVITGDQSFSGSITNPGSGYTPGSYSNVALYNNPIQTFVVTANGTTNFIFDGVPSATLNLLNAGTYRFDVSDPSMASHNLIFTTSGGGFIGSQFFSLSSGNYGQPGGYVYLIITELAATGAYAYDCGIHPGMTGVFNVSNNPSPGTYGRFALADLTVDNGGVVTNFSITTTGVGYKSGDEIIINDNFYGGSGFLYTINSVAYTGIVDSFSISNSGSGYLTGDTLSFSDASVGSGGGSGFSFIITNSPGVPLLFDFIDRGTNYNTGDKITLPGVKSGISTTLRGVVYGVSTTLSTSSAQISVTSTSGILAGMEVLQTGSDIGQISPSTTVLSVDSSTLLTLSQTPIVAGSAVLDFRSVGALDEITIPNTNGIVPGAAVIQTGGSGTLGSGVIVASVLSSNTVRLSTNPQIAGTATLSFAPQYGIPTSNLEFTVGDLGVIDEFVLVNGGIGYSVDDIISVNAENLTSTVDFVVTTETIQEITFVTPPPAGTFLVGNSIQERAGGITDVSIVTSGLTEVSQANQTYTNISASGGSGSGATFNINRGPDGDVIAVSPNSPGALYTTGNTLTILGSSIGSSSPAGNITINVNSVTSSTTLQIFKVEESGGNTDKLTVVSGGLNDGDVVLKVGSSTQYTIDTASASAYRFFIDSVITPDLTLYAGTTYKFDYSDSSNQIASFAFSTFRDGNKSPSLVENVSTILSTSTSQITVADTSGIVSGMLVTVVTANGGQLQSGTFVQSVDSATTLTLSKVPLTSGSIVLSFVGISYTDGVQVFDDYLTIKPSENTPTLYYFDSGSIVDMGGADGEEAAITIDPNNPKVFGSGFNFKVVVLETEDVITGSISNGNVNAISFSGTSANFNDVTVSNTLESDTVVTTNFEVTSIISSDTSNNISLEASSFDINSNITVNTNKVTISKLNGDLTTTGVLKTTNSLNINDKITISDNTISASAGNDINISAPANRVVKASGTCALVIPVGATTDRPGPGVVSDGAIRFNSTTNQYEGYRSSTTSWSSLGGVRDIDGNTYILAELTPAANDNTLWFYNDAKNTFKFTTSYLEFTETKKVRSLNLNTPSYINWTANTPVTVGQYLKYRHDIYEVISSGTTASAGNEPNNTTGNTFLNGSATLQYFTTAVSSLTFEEISEIRIGPNKSVPMLFEGDLRITKNTISTDLTDITFRPNTGRKIVCDARTHLTIPSGTENEKSTGTAANGSIRFNTTIKQYEGFSSDTGTWSSLGGVRDVDGNTYIIPETSPGTNENILYFYNNNINTLNLSTTGLDFANVDTITSTGSNSLEITASLFTLDAAATSIDNTSTTTTFISTTKENLDLGLSSGLTNDVVLRLNDEGDVYFNTGFGSGSQSLVRVFDKELANLEIAKYRISTSSSTLIKGTTNNSSSVIYSPSTELSAKVEFVAHNTTTGNKEIIEFSVIDNGTDIFYTEIGTIQTSGSIVDYTLDFNVNGAVRLSYSLANAVANGNIVNVTVVSNVIKK